MCPVHAEIVPTPTTGAIEIHVLARADREPLADATIVIGDQPIPGALTDACGVAVVGGLAPGHYDVHVYSDDYRTDRPHVAVDAGQVTQQSVPVGPGPRPHGVCYSDGDCPGWQVCSAGLDDYDDGVFRDFGTGVCTDGWIAVAARAQAVVIRDPDLDATTAFAVEAIPPKLAGRISLAADWWTDGRWRLGAAFWLHPHLGLAVSARLDALRTDSAWHPAAAARVEWSPIWPFSRIDGWNHVSAFAEVGVIVDDRRDPRFGSLGVELWYGLP